MMEHDGTVEFGTWHSHAQPTGAVTHSGHGFSTANHSPLVASANDLTKSDSEWSE